MLSVAERLRSLALKGVEVTFGIDPVERTFRFRAVKRIEDRKLTAEKWMIDHDIDGMSDVVLKLYLEDIEYQIDRALAGEIGKHETE